MKKVKIGVADKDEIYVNRLASYLNEMGKNIWNVAAFTNTEYLRKYIRERHINILAGTDKEMLIHFQQQFPDLGYVWLTNDKNVQRNDTYNSAKIKQIYSVYRYQSARAVGESFKDIIQHMGLIKSSEKKIIAFYSPIGRCGKTSLALRFVSENVKGKWLYVGMEDYSCSINVQGEETEDIIYYVKERKEDAIRKILAKTPSVIPSPFSMFDTRQVNREDMEWFINIFVDESVYRGAVFDIGTGVLQGLNVLLLYDIILVPYLDDAKSEEKRIQFENLVKAYELEELCERIKYINMSKRSDHLKELQVLL